MCLNGCIVHDFFTCTYSTSLCFLNLKRSGLVHEWLFFGTGALWWVGVGRRSLINAQNRFLGPKTCCIAGITPLSLFPFDSKNTFWSAWLLEWYSIQEHIRINPDKFDFGLQIPHKVKRMKERVIDKSSRYKLESRTYTAKKSNHLKDVPTLTHPTPTVVVRYSTLLDIFTPWYYYLLLGLGTTVLYRRAK